MAGERDRTPEVSVIVPARNASGTIRRTLAGLRDQACTASREVIVVDDGSTDETAAIAEAAGARVLRQAQRGPGEARNLGARVARGEILAFTDADCYPTPVWLSEGLRALKGADLVQGRVLPDPEADRGPFDHTIWVVRESGLYETANLLVRRELYLRVGGFEDWLEVDIGKRLGEDAWFGWKARRAGARTGFAENALVHHAVFPRGWRDFVAERRRLVYFPALVRKMPELRPHFLCGRLFTTSRSAAFALAFAGAASVCVAAAAGAGGWAALPGLAMGPYIWMAARRAYALGRPGPRITAVEAAADLVGFVALVRGSAHARTLVL